jgi:hypothetical protein
MEQIKANPLSSGAIDVMAQLFIYGPTWDGNIVSKSGRMELVGAGLVFHECGWASLTPEGVRTAVEWDSRGRRDNRWYIKARAGK